MAEPALCTQASSLIIHASLYKPAAPRFQLKSKPKRQRNLYAPPSARGAMPTSTSLSIPSLEIADHDACDLRPTCAASLTSRSKP
ncbi:hypothetical protein PsYK624_131240 [Phanerochaete sordida]|uniref:Uncharacterized protein n=1 Tax=Phanerochaete sordida TaxID=48140 RepID=A0A9P3GLF1_9APHY|nr:hypothetical protein PsYK624_131240 [Phanerochaete sordida]